MYKISVIMGIYNCQETLAESIDSLLNQTFNDFELIMCDDGSADGTYQIARSYCERFPEKIILLKNEKNMGLNYTLNQCLKAAKSPYIARMDGDDISLPQRFEKEVEYLDKHPEFAIVSTPMIFFDETGDWGRNYRIENPQIIDFVKHAPFFCHAPCMVRREAYMDVGGYTVDKRFLRYEDCNLWYKMYAKGYRGHNLDEPLYKMRDDRNAYKRRSFSSRLRALYVKGHGFRLVKMKKRYYFYLIPEAVKTTLLGLIPEWLYNKVHKNNLQVRS